jgi:carboxymethylenebutenolidase
MCFDEGARPPIPPIRGGAIESGPVTLSADDGNRFRAFAARAGGARPARAGIIVLPDVRGLHPYYEELAVRFAERGIDAVAIDYFGRTAGLDARDESFDHMSHVGKATFAGLVADATAAADLLRSTSGGDARAVFSIGFCFGGRLALLTATLGLDLAGVIGFYGPPVGPGRADMPAPAEVAGRIRSPLLAIYGGADQGIPATNVETFRRALDEAGVEHRVVTYDGAPHSFFDRRAEEYADASAQAWEEVLAFIAGHSGQAGQAATPGRG